MATITERFGFTKPAGSDPASIVPLNSNTDLIEQYLGRTQDMIAPMYDDTATYDVGDIVTYESNLYKCITAISTAETFDSTKWSQTSIEQIIDGVKGDVSQLNSSLTQLNGLNVVKRITTPASVVSFSDGSNLPMPSLKVGIDPIQDLHGYDYPWAGGAGKNKYPLSQNINLGGANDRKLSQTFATPLGSGTYTVSWKSTGDITSFLQIKIDGTYSSKKNGSSFSVTSSMTDLYWYISEEDYNNNKTLHIYDIQLEIGNQQTTFEPYSNICPISGWDEANVVVSPTTDAEDGTTYNIQFTDGSNPLTVYGGTLDVISGLLTVTDEYIASYNGETLPATWISDRDVYTEGTIPTTGAEVCYELATPQTYQLTPTQVKSLLGQNNVWADTGDILEVDYTGVLNFS